MKNFNIYNKHVCLPDCNLKWTLPKDLANVAI